MHSGSFAIWIHVSPLFCLCKTSFLSCHFSFICLKHLHGIFIAISFKWASALVKCVPSHAMSERMKIDPGQNKKWGKWKGRKRHEMETNEKRKITDNNAEQNSVLTVPYINTQRRRQHHHHQQLVHAVTATTAIVSTSHHQFVSGNQHY